MMDQAWINKVENELSDIKTRLAVAERDITAISNKLDKIESNTTWIVRLMVGTLVIGIIGFIIKGGINV